MKRSKGFEWEDQPWFPQFLRQYMMDFLRFVLNTGNLYHPVTPILAEGLQRTGSQHIVDLCSGGGGAIAVVQSNLKKLAGITVSFTLTDLYPNAAFIPSLHDQSCNEITYYSQPVNAADVPSAVTGFRTMFSAFHHFDESAAKQVLQNAVNAGEGIAIFDGGSRSLWFMLVILLFQPVAFVLFTPFIKPFSIGRLLFTYLLPVVPFCTVWDGMTSVLRLYKPDELLQLAHAADAGNRYAWQCGKVRNRLGISIAYLAGYPVDSKTQ